LWWFCAVMMWKRDGDVRMAAAFRQTVALNNMTTANVYRSVSYDAPTKAITRVQAVTMPAPPNFPFNCSFTVG